MHGLVANQLRRYVVSRYGRNAWTTALQISSSALPEGPPPLDETVPDEDMIAVIMAVADEADTSVPQLLGDFGMFLAAGLLRIYAPLVLPHWRTLDVIAHVEEHIHTVVRLRDQDAHPPYLVARRTSLNAVEVVYVSPRRLCALAEGIVRGLAEHFDERVTVSQSECMLRGDARCVLSVTLLPQQVA